MPVTHNMALQAMGELTGRQFHSLLKLWQIGVNDRECRHWKAGTRTMPECVYMAGLQLQFELEPNNEVTQCNSVTTKSA